jgi:hypothetical protein
MRHQPLAITGTCNPIGEPFDSVQALSIRDARLASVCARYDPCSEQCGLQVRAEATVRCAGLRRAQLSTPVKKCRIQWIFR